MSPQDPEQSHESSFPPRGGLRGAQRGRRQQDGPLAGHFREGRHYRPPFLAIPQFELQDWVRDDLPDLIWLVLLAARMGDRVATPLGRFQMATHEACGESPDVVVDGRLTSLERVPHEHRATVIELADRHRELFPSDVGDILRLYPNSPGSWLLGQAHDGPSATDEGHVLELLATSIARVAADGHLTALVKFAPIAWSVASASGTFDRTTIDLLCDYPSVPSKFPAADSVIRASFGARQGADALRDGGRAHAETLAWARAFWAHNWKITECIPEERTTLSQGTRNDDNNLSDGIADRDEDRVLNDDTRFEALSDDAQQAIVAAFNGFLDSALDHDRTIDLHSPARHEVVVGCASRAARAALALARTPELWSGEHTSATTRLLTETEIVLRWMDEQGDEIFERFKDYGAGKRKLMRLHLESIAAQMDADTREPVTDALRFLGARTGGEHGEQFQNVSLDATFADKSLRQMADECGALELYRHLYQPASGITHGEWWAIEDYAMQRCLNPLHRFHRIPSFDAQFAPTEGFGTFLVDQLERILYIANKMLVVEPSPRPADNQD